MEEEPLIDLQRTAMHYLMVPLQGTHMPRSSSIVILAITVVMCGILSASADPVAPAAPQPSAEVRPKTAQERQQTALDKAQRSLEQVFKWPDNTKGVAFAQADRAKALLAAGKPQEALAAAKGYYNVCLLKDSANAINLVALCLAAARPDDKGIVKRFRAQQLAHSGGDATTQPTTQPDLGEPIMPTIKVDAALYDDAIQAVAPTGVAKMLAKGNLLLLADRTKEARALMEQMSDMASAEDMATATEAVARAIRAEAGYVGPANKYIMEQRGQAGNP